MLEGKVAIVTGAGSGIGLAIARQLHHQGARVALVGRNLEKLEAACRSMGGGNSLLPLAGDLRHEADAVQVVAGTAAAFGTVDILINSAGVSQRENVMAQDMALEEFKRIMDTNVDSVMLMTREALKIMQRQDSGYIINILSGASYLAQAGVGMYAASKHAAKALTQALADECRGSGIRVSSISPGPVATGIWSHKLAPPSNERLDSMLRPSDIADIALFLLNTHGNVYIDNIMVNPWRPLK